MRTIWYVMKECNSRGINHNHEDGGLPHIASPTYTETNIHSKKAKQKMKTNQTNILRWNLIQDENFRSPSEKDEAATILLSGNLVSQSIWWVVWDHHQLSLGTSEDCKEFHFVDMELRWRRVNKSESKAGQLAKCKKFSVAMWKCARGANQRLRFCKFFRRSEIQIQKKNINLSCLPGLVQF